MRCNRVASFGGWFSPATFTCVCVLIAAAIGRAAEPMAAGGGEKTAQAGDVDLTPHPVPRALLRHEQRVATATRQDTRTRKRTSH